MDSRRKIEEAISTFNARRQQVDGLNSGNNEKTKNKKSLKDTKSQKMSSASKSSPFTLPVLLTADRRMDVVEREKTQDVVMEEFDKFVLHQELKKGAEEMNRVVDGIDKDLLDTENISNHEPTAQEQTTIPTEKPVPKETRPDSGEPTTNENAVQDYDNVPAELDIGESTNGNEETSEEEISVDEEDLQDGEEEYLFPTPDEVKNAKAPEVGIVFSTLEAAVRFINVYGQLFGFSMIKGRNHKHRKITLQCNKSRRIVSRAIGQRRRRRSTIGRTNCKMNVTVKLVETKWQIISCVMEHNHDLASSPSLTKFFLSHRTMSQEEIMLSKLLQDIRVKPQRIMTIFRKLKGSFGNVTFGKKKLDNLKQAERKKRRNSAIDCTLKYIEKLQVEKPGFCCKMEVDTEGAVRSIFWTDARSRMDYRFFGEIICFDTTYSTNKYNMPFTPIIGINGHVKTIVFGWALLKDQTEPTFRWLFESFIEIMEGKKLRLIFTDQDVAMKNAISAIFPDAWRIFCIWHVLKCLRENMSAYMAEREGMELCIVRLIMQSLNVTEFETGWKC